MLELLNLFCIGLEKLKTKKTLAVNTSLIWIYFLLTFAWSWFFWILTSFLEMDVHFRLVQLGLVLGALGPPIFGIFFTYKSSKKNALRNYLRRIWDWKNFNYFWLVMTLFTVPALAWIAGETDVILGGVGLTFKLNSAMFLFIPKLPILLLVPLVVVYFILLGPLPEELGWRGYALDPLQKKFGPWRGSFILGIFWGLWHLPLFFIAGFHDSFSSFAIKFGFLFVAILIVSPIITWIYNHTKQSILSAILFHFACNLSMENTVSSNLTKIIWIFLCFLWVLAVWGKDRSLGYFRVKRTT